MKEYLITGYISVPVYSTVQAKDEEEAFDSFMAEIQQEHGYDVDYDNVMVAEQDSE